MAAAIGMVVIITPHTRKTTKLNEEEVTCYCKCSDDEKNENESAELSSASKAASLLQVLGDGIVLALNSLLEIVNPLNISLGDVLALIDSLGLVCETVTKISVLAKSLKKLITVRSESSVLESVDILGNAIDLNTELCAAELVKLDVCAQKLFINFSVFSAHDYKPHLKNFFSKYIIQYIF